LKILVTGSKGFIGKNLVAELRNRGYTDLRLFDRGTDSQSLYDFTRDCDFVFHLAGVNRSKDEGEFTEGNPRLTRRLLDALRENCNYCPVMVASSIQAELDNAYGRSKKAAEDLAFAYGRETGAKVLVYRFPNVFGKWCKPNYNSVIATFCHNVARDLPIHINDPATVLTLVYIDDVVAELANALKGKETRYGEFCQVPVVYQVTLSRIAELIYEFRRSREKRSIPNMADEFTKKLYGTYLSYLPEGQFSYALNMHVDDRGSFTELIRTPDRGQVSVNIIKPGITKGNHWHHTKNEKFLVVSGQGVIRFRRVDSGKVIEYFVSGDKLEVVDIPPGYTHNIQNLGNTDMVVVMWANEPYDPQKPDTYWLEV
jgi:UDP-2-acetamido-2,6-beta-L-arabino-hexul-4-ose reductase